MATDIMSLLGNVPKSALERIFAALSGLPEAQYEHTGPRVERQPSVPVQVGDGSGPLDGPMELPPPRETLPGAPERTGRLSGFGRFAKQILPEMVRGAVVGASTPVKGGTAENIFGTIRNVADDRQERQDRAQGQAEKQFQWHRQIGQDADRRELHGAQMDNYRAQAEQRRAAANRQPAVKDPIAAAKAKIGLIREQLGRDPTEQEVLIAMGLQGPRYAKRDMKAMVANADEDFFRGPDAQRLQDTYGTVEDYIKYVTTLAKDYAASESGGAAYGKWANTPVQSKTLLTSEGVASYFPGRMNPQTGTVTTTPKVEQTGVKPPERKVAPPRPRQPGPADDRRNEQKTVERIANEAFNAAGGDALKAIKILNERARTDKEVAANLVGATKRLQSAVPKTDIGAQLEQFLGGPRGQSTGGGAVEWTRDPQTGKPVPKR
jgi:hypothetical protein